MRVVVTGGTGFIGATLVSALLRDGHAVAVLTRRPAAVPPGAEAVAWDARSAGAWRRALAGADAVVNLAGESIAARRWTPAQRQRILESRVAATRALVEALAGASPRPRVLVSGSAVGYYGPRGDEEVTEADPPGDDFLARVCVAWEAEARRAEGFGVRVALLRTGVVLGRGGGVLPRFLLPFRLFVGGPLGHGRQWLPWIHLDDLVRLIRFLLEHDDAVGPFNGTAPRPVRQEEFCRTLARVLRRPCWLRVPAPLLRLTLGELADALILSGQRAVPARASQLGFRFHHPELEGALRHLLGRGGSDAEPPQGAGADVPAGGERP